MRPAELEERARVLVADDARKNLELIQAVLTLGGYEVITASDGEEAQRKIETEPVDLVLLDVMMPKLNGYELCARLKGNDRTRLIPVVLLASLDELEDKVRAFEVGADDFVHRPIRRAELLARVRSLVGVKRLNEELVNGEDALLALATAIEAKDPYAKGHIERVVDYTTSLGRKIGMSRREQQLMRKAAILHDVGKMGIRESVLFKPGPLTAEEREHLKAHPIIGQSICQSLVRERMVLEVVRHHHERYHGQGYPDGLVGEKIPLAARIMAIADAHDALTSARPYRQQMSEEESLGVLGREAGEQFDPMLVPVFIDMITARGGLKAPGIPANLST